MKVAEHLNTDLKSGLIESTKRSCVNHTVRKIYEVSDKAEEKMLGYSFNGHKSIN